MSNYKEVWIEENIFLCLINLFGDKNFLIDLRFRGSAFFCIFNYNSVTLLQPIFKRCKSIFALLSGAWGRGGRSFHPLIYF